MRLLSVMLLCALLFPAYASAQLVKLQISPETTVVTSPLDANCVPDYQAAIEARLSAGATPENNFWTLVWPALGNAEHSSPAYLRAVEQKLGVTIPEQGLYHNLRTTQDQAANSQLFEHMDAAMNGPWKRSEYPEISQWLDENDEFLQVVEQACQRSHTYAPLASTEEGASLAWILLPHVQRSRDVSRLLISRSMLRLGEGHTEGAWQDLLTSYRLAHHVEQGFTLIERLVGVAIRTMTTNAAGVWLNHGGLTADQLAAHRAELAPLLEVPGYADCVDTGERFMILQMAIHISNGSLSQEDFRATFEPPVAVLAGPNSPTSASSKMQPEDQLIQQLNQTRGPLLQYLLTGSDINVTLRQLNRTYDQLTAALQLPTHPERVAALTDFSSATGADAQLANNGVRLLEEFVFATDEDYQTLPARVLSGAMTPTISNINEAHTRALGRRAALLAGFQIAEQMQRTGTVPQSLSDVQGELPRDPYTEGNLKLHINAGQLQIYSVGKNLCDDAGKTFGEGDGMDDVGITLLVL